MGKETVLVKESPGFVTSRINAMIGNEAFYMLQEGVACARDIDKALKLGLNHPMGPFELVDLVGLDTRLSILQYLHRTLGEKFRPCPLLEQHVKAGASAARSAGASTTTERRSYPALQAGVAGWLWSWKPQLRTTLKLPLVRDWPVSRKPDLIHRRAVFVRRVRIDAMSCARAVAVGEGDAAALPDRDGRWRNHTGAGDGDRRGVRGAARTAAAR